MDPALQEMIDGSGGDEVEAVVRLTSGAEPPPGVRLIARFGEEIATCRMPRARIAAAWADDAVASLKAPRPFGVDPDPLPEEAEAGEDAEGTGPARRPEGLPETGRGVIVGVIDWGFDFAHPNFRNADGSTRALAFWDQSAPGPGPEPYGYGRVFLKEEIDRALATAQPYEALGYHPASGDPGGRGAHGTHVLDIAAGNGRAEGALQGVAPEADLVFVHLASRGTDGRANLGNLVTLLEGWDWVARLAGERPWVGNLSMGRHGGDHKGRSLVEQALDAMVTEKPGRAIVQSTGNYLGAQAHAEGILRPGHERTLRWWTDPADRTPNELEVWYPGSDVFGIELRSPEGGPAFRIPLGGQASIEIGGREAGSAYHRAKEPNSGDNHVDIFLYPEAPAGRWDVVLTAADVVDGRYHAWVERDAGCPSCQSRLDPEDAVQTTTTGTICNGYRSLVVGAYDARSPEREPAPFSSSGPTRDGRVKPDLLAPGVRILAARSASFEQGEETPPLTRMSGTSMAAPHVTGAVALVFQAAGRPLRIEETRRLLLATAEPAPAASADWAQRVGSGYLDIERAVAAAREEKAMNSRETEEETHDSPVSCSCGGRHTEVATPQEDLEDDLPWEEDETEEEPRSAEVRLLGPEGRPASPAEVFDAFTVPRWPGVRRHFEQSFEVVALPGGVAESVRPSDLLVRRALGEGGLGFLEEIGVPSGFQGLRLPLDGMILRPRAAFLRECAGCSGEFAEADGDHQCLPGEGPPAVLPDPEGRGLHPLVYRGVTAKRSRNPTVGDAQQLLNVFLDATRDDPFAGCEARDEKTRKYIAGLRAQLRANQQDPLTVDCRFGPSTEIAAKMFQACKGIERDGKIGKTTWSHLAKLRGKTEPKLPKVPVPTLADPPDPGVRRWFSPGNLSVLREGNAVTALVTGEDVFKEMVAAIRTARQAGHSIFLLGWELQIQFELIRGNSSTTIQELFTTASKAGVQILAMLNSHQLNGAFIGANNQPAIDFINSLRNCRAIHDSRYLNAGTHHQKVLVVNGTNGLIAFAGGVDLNPNRFVFHDVHCRFQGPAAWDYYRLFHERWADHPDSQGLGFVLNRPPALPGVSGDLHVQVARTYGNGASHAGIDAIFLGDFVLTKGYTFSPVGERSVEALINHAISQAERFIYIEDQYLVNMEVSRTLARKLPSLELLVILICDTDRVNPDLGQGWHRRKQFVDNLTRVDASKVIVCFGTQYYIHSKTWIFDDRFAVVGSANINRRGFTHDSEQMAGIADPNAAGNRFFFAHDLRMKLWSKHLGLPFNALADPIASAVHWRTPPARARIAAYNPDAGADSPPLHKIGDPSWNTFIDPDGS